MRTLSSNVHRPSRRAAHLTAVAVALVATGLAMTGASPAAGQQVIEPGLHYACTYPSGLRASIVRADVQIRATFPQAGVVGQPIQPAGAALALTLPHSEVASLTGMHAATVTAGMRLTVDVAENHASVTDPWSGQTTAATPLPAAGSAVLTASSTVPSATVKVPGDVTFTAAAFSVLLTPRTAAGGPTNPPVIPLSCQLLPGQQATLATLAVAAASSPSGPGGSASTNPISVGPRRAAATNYCPGYPTGGYKFNPHFPLPKPPPGSKVTHPTPQEACAFIVGFSNARKLNEAALVGPGRSNLSVNIRVVEDLKTGYFQLDSAGELAYKPCATCKVENALPPAHATFLSFGFVPTSATLQITQIGTLNVASVGTTSALKYSRIWSTASIRVYNVLVNGVPLNVGNNCQTQTPFPLVLTGKPPYTLQLGGQLTGTINIPPFSGCGVGENLNPIFDATVSGPGNFVKLTQGNLCTPGPPPFGCPPLPPTPVH